MKILLLADPLSSHTIKWAKSLAEKNIDITIFGLGSFSSDEYSNIKNIKVVTLNTIVSKREGTFAKLNYLRALPKLKQVINNFKPDIIHAHYASSYGLLGSLSGFSPFILSVWGSDVFSFPNKSFIHKMILKFNFYKANKILSTSNVMAKEIKLYTNKDIQVTPFGIDVQKYKPMIVESLFKKEDIVIGTIKSLESIYGIEYLIRAFKLLSDKYLDLPLKLLIVGSGRLEKDLKNLVKELELDSKTVFTGHIPFNEVSKYHNMLSVFIALSNSESFGVAVIEASACGKPVVVSDVGGLPEVVENEVTGFIVPPKSPETAAKVIEKLVLNEELQKKLGENGRNKVKNLFNWEDNLNQMIKIYDDTLKH